MRTAPTLVVLVVANCGAFHRDISVRCHFSTPFVAPGTRQQPDRLLVVPRAKNRSPVPSSRTNPSSNLQKDLRLYANQYSSYTHEPQKILNERRYTKGPTRILGRRPDVNMNHQEQRVFVDSCRNYTPLPPPRASHTFRFFSWPSIKPRKILAC